MAKPINWTEEMPDCDICFYVDDIPGTPGIYDGKTKAGPWANMCAKHLKSHGYEASDELTFQRIPNNT